VLHENLRQTTESEFSAIKTMADVQKMARDDYPRYVRWDAAQKQMHAVSMEMQAEHQRRAADRAAQWQAYAKSQDDIVMERVPELKDPDPARRAAFSQECFWTLKETYGMSDEQIRQSYQGGALRSAAGQLMVADATRWRLAQAGRNPQDDGHAPLWCC
jgi:hypothetical protein